jgi:hypothetical protein
VPKKKNNSLCGQNIKVDPNAGGTLTVEVLEAVMKKALQQPVVTNQPFSFIDEFDDWYKIRDYNKQRFVNYCHKGTIIEHRTSKVKWEVLGFGDTIVHEPGPSFTTFEVPKKFLKIRSLNGGSKLRKYEKRVDIDTHFSMYDIIDVPEAVKVLWGDPKDNPPKKPGDKV